MVYKHLVRPILFRLSPERAHSIAFLGLKLLRILGLKSIVKKMMFPCSLQMETEFCGLKFLNKVGVAAGLDKNAEVFDMFGSLGFGHVEIGTVTPKPQPGNPKPRLFRLAIDKALINRMGFNNRGLKSAVKRLQNRDKQLIIGGNIGKNTLTRNEDALSDYVQCFEGLYSHVDYVVVNVSCPNISDLHKLQDQDELEKILSELNRLRSQKEVYKPILLKISPDLNQLQVDETIEVVLRNAIDGIIATNTTVSREGLLTPADKVRSIANGGLSGKPTANRSTAMIKYIHDKTKGKLPIIAVGGIFTSADVIEKLEAGATLVQIYTGFIYEGPGLAKRINKDLISYYKSKFTG
ncbi:MAG: quinone-dependent dihydroorotate dehydrogenase [Salinivirgaceae bacterium]|nr:quinone-dependent dihydroorotate dehydrogenase [Salinivirgaceae bacterium]